MPIFSSLAADNDPEANGAADLQEFAQTLYGRGLVSEACLRLQDESGVDVNLLLFAVWAACRRLVLNEPEAARAIELCTRWREHVVLPARALRRGIKGLANVVESEDLYKHSKNLELAAEYAQLSLLSSLDLQQGEYPFSELVLRNIGAYAANLPKRFSKEDAEIIITAARQLVAERELY